MNGPFYLGYETMTKIGTMTQEEYELLCEELRERMIDCIVMGGLTVPEKETLENMNVETEYNTLQFLYLFIC